MKNTLPHFKNNNFDVNSLEYVTASVVGTMADGTKVWEDNKGKQFSKIKFGDTYIFVDL